MSIEVVAYLLIIGFVIIPLSVMSMEVARRKGHIKIRSMYARIKAKKIRLFWKEGNTNDPIDIAAENILKILNSGVEPIQKNS